ncbi:MAG: alpha/beta hydrolase [Anaerolineae bacterium]|nr:alpha/beta hydrolase [Anaerolineae bacterium]
MRERFYAMLHHHTYRVLALRTLIHVRDWEGASPPILFLHSITANSLLALTLGELISPHRRLIAPDLRGRGKSDAPAGDYGPTLHVREMIALMDALRVEKFVIAGHSFGAMLSVLIAAQYPDRVTGLILFDGGAPPDSLATMALNAYYNSLQYRYPSVEAYLDRFQQSPLYQPWTESLEQLVRSNLYREPDGSYIRSVGRYVLDAERTPENMAVWASLPDLYPHIACPVLILRAGMGVIGAADPALPDEAIALMRAQMPQAQIVTIPEAAHTSLMTIPSPLRDQSLLRFLGINRP